ncbi:hypothetical protein ACQUW5_06125 [Legionella sp. CNM-1927-20]|uniref:hypothetical protein n=1 Tax=Legionella sp. CNM-1927-20 TaxID=3422221 RepID=UPI00403AA390
MIGILIYLAGIILWPIIWFFLDGYSLFLENRKIIIPFILCIIILVGNIILQVFNDSVLPVHLEEDLFRFLDHRSSIIINIISGILILSAVVYSVGDREMPRLFLRFISTTYITLLGFMIPILWIPTNKPEWLQILRFYQTVPFTYSIFFATTSILILLADILKWLGEERE